MSKLQTYGQVQKAHNETRQKPRVSLLLVYTMLAQTHCQQTPNVATVGVFDVRACTQLAFLLIRVSTLVLYCCIPALDYKACCEVDGVTERIHAIHFASCSTLCVTASCHFVAFATLQTMLSFLCVLIDVDSGKLVDPENNERSEAGPLPWKYIQPLSEYLATDWMPFLTEIGLGVCLLGEHLPHARSSNCQENFGVQCFQSTRTLLLYNCENTNCPYRRLKCRLQNLRSICVCMFIT